MPEKRNRRKTGSARRPCARPSQTRVNPRSAEPTPYPPALLKSLARGGYVDATRLDDKIGYSTQDREILRIARAMYEVSIPIPKVLAALRRLRAASRVGDVVWDASGMSHTLPTVLDLRAANATTVKRRAAVERRREEAARHYESGLALEESDLVGARDAYLAALAAHGDHLEARINLGRLRRRGGGRAGAGGGGRAAGRAGARGS